MVLKKYKLENNNLKGYKIIHLSDFHNSRSKHKLKFIIDNINKIKPNIIVITGDLFDYYFYNANKVIDLLKNINDIPIYMVLGNHEQRIKKDIMPILTNNNVKLLNNENLLIDNLINIIGINHNYNDLDNLIDNKYYNLLLTHKPDNFWQFSQKNIDLILCGHTHGESFSKGLYEENNTTMIVSRGISATLFRIRFKTSELVYIEFI